MTKETALAIVQKLDINTYVDKYDVIDKVYELGLSNEIAVFDGASKICLVFSNCNYVIKWSKEADHQEPENNDALKEVEIYAKAKEVGLEMFFPYTELAGKINDVYFILQAKVDYSARRCPVRKKEKYRHISQTASVKLISKMHDDIKIENTEYNRTLDSLWAGMALTIYGKALCKRLCEFIRENRINDLHGGNIGYKNDKPIIIDFSGYFD